VKGRRKVLLSPQAEMKLLALIIGVVAIPLSAALWAVVATTRQDLSDLAPIQPSDGVATYLDWSTLLHSHSSRPPSLPVPHDGSAVRALGYMSESDRAIPDGQWVQDFVLLPDAGNALHPAHRFGDQMLAVRLRRDSPVQFSSGKLVWVWGTFRRFAGDPTGAIPLYALEQARLQNAGPREIPRHFR
jgi:hypothetical protein